MNTIYPEEIPKIKKIKNILKKSQMYYKSQENPRNLKKEITKVHRIPKKNPKNPNPI